MTIYTGRRLLHLEDNLLKVGIAQIKATDPLLKVEAEKKSFPKPWGPGP
jgi:hypothetical protein